MNNGSKRCRHWTKNCWFAPNWTERSVEKLVKYSPDEFASEFGGIVNFSDPAPEALIVVSISGTATPGKTPELSPYPPEIVLTVSNPTHLTTFGSAQRVAKSAPKADDDIASTVEKIAAMASLSAITSLSPRSRRKSADRTAANVPREKRVRVDR